MKGSLAFIYGGRGLEREVSLLGADFLLPIIENTGYGCIPIYITSDGRWLVSRQGDDFVRPDRYGSGECAGLINMGGRGGICLGGEIVMIDSAFPLLHGDFGEDGSIQGALETAAIPFVGEGVYTSALCLDKAACRVLTDGLSVRGAKWFSPPLGMNADEVADVVAARLGYPIFVKPTSLGSSIGASKADSREALIMAYLYASDNLRRRVMIEELVDIDCELEVGVIRTKGKYIFTKIGKIKNGIGFYSYGEKYSSDSIAEVDPDYVASSEVEKSILEKAETLALALDIRSLARIDFFLDKKGEIYFNEINTMPGFTRASLFWRLFSRVGISPLELVDTLVKESMS
jgi:D-alanine-D-alanine ligase